ncbi:MAG: hypothetical protein DWQ47_02180 [Acidobacteria bacterium]|nr:MAG: hypothetical protein DWQ32_05730 [Acidobacteriota bacterium]REK01228.1 MAG: hypothetical protein DWQ38_02165 [Acidobacteriota bacterium]REK14184.1 MAG: hypothetical protein DWQ43_11420 [Acidobacteriota bacterium]REK44899.1 MAG: hypothetical protein DWQ47_02180 [Acidobacteriota bacterium]
MTEPKSEKKMLSRREFGSLALGSIATIAFSQTLLSACSTNEGVAEATPRIIGPKAAPIVRHWVLELQEISSDLRSSSIPVRMWQEKIEALFSRIELKDLLKDIDFETLRKRVEMPDLGVGTAPVVFPVIDGLPEKTVFVKKIFGMKKGRAIVPHGHSNMASAHLILAGGFHMRHFEKLEDKGDSLLIRPTLDKNVKPGDASSISDEKDNVHWFIAESDESYTFDVIMLDLAGKKYDIHNLDIEKAETAGNGDLRAPKIDVNKALKKYGKQHHGEQSS